jgi:hypothetical protein
MTILPSGRKNAIRGSHTAPMEFIPLAQSPGHLPTAWGKTGQSRRTAQVADIDPAVSLQIGPLVAH